MADNFSNDRNVTANTEVELDMIHAKNLCRLLNVAIKAAESKL